MSEILLRQRYTLRQRVLFLRQLGFILQSGLPLLQGLELLERQPETALRSLCHRLLRCLHGGSTLAAAMEGEPAFFPQLTVKLTAAGEESGELAAMLQQLADYYDRMDKLRRFVLQAMLYPALLLVAAVAVLALFLFFILPRLLELYASLGVKPTGTLALALRLQELGTATPLVTVAAVCLLLGLLAAGGRLALKRFLRSRWSGNFQGLLLEVRFCKLLALLLDSGLPITRAVAIAAAAVDDREYQRGLLLLNSRLQRGVAIEEAAGGSQLFSSLTLQLFSVGAATGYLPQLLREAAAAGELRLQEQLGRSKQLLVPVLLMIAALIIAAVVVTVMGPLFEMLTALPE